MLPEVFRRALAIGIGALSVSVPAASATAETRAAIIDTAWDTRPFLRELRASGVLAIGRYLARCPQPERNIPQKRLIDQGGADDRNSEVRQILANGIAILSIYQYNNDSKNKFSGRDRNGRPLPDAACRPTDRPRTSAEEGRLDASAAVAQARALGQPRGSAIYFGVDIAFSRADAATKSAMLSYFVPVERILRRAGFRLGAYGNGDALEVLRAARLIDFGWLSASRAFPGTSRVHNSGRWHLFQNGVNLIWYDGTPGACRGGLPLDTNVKNSAFANEGIGLWSASGVVRLPARRTRAVYAARRFACDGDARIRRTPQSSARDTIGGTARCVGRRTGRHPETIDYANSVVIGARSGDLVAVDHDEDGRFDGWTAASNLTPSFARKPEWIFDRRQRRAARCP